MKKILLVLTILLMSTLSYSQSNVLYYQEGYYYSQRTQLRVDNVFYNGRISYKVARWQLDWVNRITLNEARRDMNGNLYWYPIHNYTGRAWRFNWLYYYYL